MAKKDYQNKNLDKNFIQKDNTFAFNCQECGQCCRNIAKEDKILLSTVDLYRAAKALDMEVTDVIEKYCDMVPGGESMLPLLILKEHMDGSCIFLKKGKCIIHKEKPIICSLYPLGRMFMYNEEKDDHEFHYYLDDLDPGCAATKDRIVKVQDWLDEFDIEKYDECMKLYKRLGSFCSKLMHESETIEEKRNMFSTAFYLMYAKYDKSIDLYGQLAQNLAFIQSINPTQAFDPSKLN